MQASEFVQQAIWQVLLLAAPILITSLVVGLLIGLFQSVKQIQDHTLAFVPKLLAILVVVVICLPWLFEKMSDYSRQLYQEVPQNISAGNP